MTIRLALISMNYREISEGKWAKPFGFHAFTYSEEKNEWVNWFICGTGEIACWERKYFHKDSEEKYGTFVSQLKNWEAYTRINIDASCNSEFQLSANDI